MSVLSRWRGRLRTRQTLEASAKREHTAAQADLTASRRRDQHPRAPLITRRNASTAKLKHRRVQTAAAKRIIARHEHDASPRAVALKWGAALAGKVHEQPAGSNKGPLITQWEIDSGYPWVAAARNGVAWCQCFANAFAVHGGCPQLHTGYTPTVLAGPGHGYTPIKLAEAVAADMIFFKFPGVSNATCDHVGILLSRTATTVTCIEGNTSGGTAGSQNDGGGVYIRTRPISLVAGAVRPPYSKEIS